MFGKERKVVMNDIMVSRMRMLVSVTYNKEKRVFRKR